MTRISIRGFVCVGGDFWEGGAGGVGGDVLFWVVGAGLALPHENGEEGFRG